MKKFGVFLIALFIIVASVGVHAKERTSGVNSFIRESSVGFDIPVQLAVLSPQEDQAVSGDFFMTGIALDKAEGVESVDVSFASLYDKAQEPVKEYKARYIESENKWSTHVRSGELPDGVYDVKVAMHTKDGNTKFVFYNLIVDSSLTSRITTL